MKKRIVIGLLIVGLLVITGCKNASNNNTGEEKKQEEVTETKIDDLKVTLSSTGSFNGITYKYPSDAVASSFGTYNIIDYMNNKEFVFRIAMYLFENKTLEQTMSDTELAKQKTKTINGKEWHLYEDVAEDGKKMINYAYQHSNGTYTITFIYEKDINDFIDVFMNNVKFK